MKEENIVIDINRLDIDDLEILARITYNQGRMVDDKKIQERLAFLKEWMSPGEEKEYIKKYC